MIFYIIIFIASVIGVAFITMRHWRDLSERYESFAIEHPATFAYFMRDVAQEFHDLWSAHLRERILLSVEKRLRWIRIFVLKVEHFLFRATHRVRDASQRGSGDSNTSDETDNFENKIES